MTYLFEEYSDEARAQQVHFIPTDQNNPCCCCVPHRCIDIVNTALEPPQTEDSCVSAAFFIPGGLSLLLGSLICCTNLSWPTASIFCCLTVTGGNLMSWTCNFFCNIKKRAQLTKEVCRNDEAIAAGIAADGGDETLELNGIGVHDGQILIPTTSELT
jgi:hypothetical protein